MKVYTFEWFYPQLLKFCTYFLQVNKCYSSVTFVTKILQDPVIPCRSKYLNFQKTQSFYILQCEIGALLCVCICAKPSVLTVVRLFAILLISYTNLKVNVSISSSILSLKFLLWNLYNIFYMIYFLYDFWPAHSDCMLTRRSRFSCHSQHSMFFRSSIYLTASTLFPSARRARHLHLGLSPEVLHSRVLLSCLILGAKVAKSNLCVLSTLKPCYCYL